MNKTLQEIQSELKVWTEYNFGNPTPEVAILGMIEELGELSHAILKEKQGIRQSDFLADKKDAIADLTIYTLNYLNANDFKYYGNQLSKSYLTECEILQDISVQIGMLDNEVSGIEMFTNSGNIEYLISLLKGLCNMFEIDFLTTVNEVWEQVKLRDWKKYPKDGRTE